MTGNDGDARQPVLSCDLVTLALYGTYVPGTRRAALPVWRYALEAVIAIAVILAIVYLLPAPA